MRGNKALRLSDTPPPCCVLHRRTAPHGRPSTGPRLCSTGWREPRPQCCWEGRRVRQGGPLGGGGGAPGGRESHGERARGGGGGCQQHHWADRVYDYRRGGCWVVRERCISAWEGPSVSAIWRPLSIHPHTCSLPPPSLVLAGECGRAHLLCAPLTQYAPLNTPLRFPSLPPLSQPRRVPCSLCWVQACQETMSPAPRCERVWGGAV